MAEWNVAYMNPVGRVSSPSYPSGVIELGQDEEDVLLTRLQGAVLEAAVLQLVSESEEGRQGGGGEARRDVGPTEVHLPLAWVQLLLTYVLQQLKSGETTTAHRFHMTVHTTVPSDLFLKTLAVVIRLR